MAKSAFGGILFKTALVVGTAVLVARNEKVRQRVSDAVDTVQGWWRKAIERGEQIQKARRGGAAQGPVVEAEEEEEA